MIKKYDDWWTHEWDKWTKQGNVKQNYEVWMRSWVRQQKRKMNCRNSTTMHAGTYIKQKEKKEKQKKVIKEIGKKDREWWSVWTKENAQSAWNTKRWRRYEHRKRFDCFNSLAAEWTSILRWCARWCPRCRPGWRCWRWRRWRPLPSPLRLQRGRMRHPWGWPLVTAATTRRNNQPTSLTLPTIFWFYHQHPRYQVPKNFH